MIDLANIAGFDWDLGNARKNEKHGVSAGEAELGSRYAQKGAKNL
jgi:hypothetical protein